MPWPTHSEIIGTVSYLGLSERHRESVQIFRRKHEDIDDDTPVPGGLLIQRPPVEPATFSGARRVGDFLIFDWATAYGTVGWAHYLLDSGAPATLLANAVYAEFWDHMHDVYAALALPSGGLGLDMEPRLQAIDLHRGSRHSSPYKVTWGQLAAVLGTAPPWFHWALRDQDAMEAWKPGDPPAIVPADHMDVPARHLVELAADEPDGSPVAAACLWLAREARARARKEALDDIERVRDAASRPGSDSAHVHVAVVPAPALRSDEDEPGETVMRAAWSQITERRDTLAWQVAQLALRWDGGRAWPGGESAELEPKSSPAAAEWTARLKPAPAGQPPTVLERLLLEHVSSVDHGELLHDDASGFPALRRTDHLGKVTVFASVPQRIATTSPLAEVTFGGHTVWVRTENGRLWLAPEMPGAGLSWGYSGGGPLALALLLDRLLDDITAPPVQPADTGPVNDGLFSLVESAPQDDVTTYKRAQLLAARAG